MRKRSLIAIPLAIVLMASTALYVRAAEGDGALACADIIGGRVTYTSAEKGSRVLGAEGWTTPGSVVFEGRLAAPSCPDVQYGVVVVDSLPLAASQTPYVLAASSAPGDGVRDQFFFDLEISEVAAETVCVYAYTMGSTGTSASGKTGAAFDGAAPGGMLDRAPDLPSIPPAEGDKYCISEESGGTGGSSGYN